MAIDKAVDSGALDAMFTDIGNAIREKDGTTALIPPGEMPAKIRAIQTGKDTSDATVTAGDMAKGVVAYGSGGKVTGTVTEIKYAKNWACGNPYDQAGTGRLLRASPIGAMAQRTVDADVLLRAGATVGVAVPLSTLGDATAADVAKGKTFTSAAGVAVVGTREGLGDEVTVTLINNTYDYTLSYSFPTYNSYGGITGISVGEIPTGNSGEITVRAGAVVSCTAIGNGSYVIKALPNSVVQGNAEHLVTFVVPSEPETQGEPITVTITQA